MDYPEAYEFRVVQVAPLTRREAEVLLWTAEGKTAWEAGRILGITEGTTRAHLAHTIDKLHAANKVHAVARAFSVGIIARKLIAALLIVSGSAIATDTQASRVPRRPMQRVTRSVSFTRASRSF